MFQPNTNYSMKLGEIARLVGGELYGDPGIEIHGIASLETAQQGEISFLANPRYQHYVQKTHASALLLPKGEWYLSQAYITCENPYYGFALLMQRFYPLHPLQAEGQHPGAEVAENVTLGMEVSIGAFVVIEADVQIGDRVKIFPGCYIGKNTTIGDEVTLYPHVMIREGVEIGNRVIIHSGAVIGSDGFGFAQEKGVYYKIPQIGKVVIEDDVEIGANCCIDRATLGETRIHRGTKLDNLIQIAHNVSVGEHTVIAAQTGISGSTQLGHHCMIGGQVGMVGHITIGDFVICGAQAGVTKSIPAKTFVSGYPARPHREQLKIEASQMRLPELIRRIKEMEKRLAALESTPDGINRQNKNLKS